MPDAIGQKIVQNIFEGAADVGKGMKDESSQWGKTAWDSIMSPSDPKAAAEAKQAELTNKQKDSQRAAEWRRYFHEMAQKDAQVRQQIDQKKQVKEQEKKQEVQIKHYKAVEKVQKQRQMNEAVFQAERASEIKGKSVGG